MTKNRWRCATLVLLLGTVILSAAPARTPEQLLKNLVEAAQKGDVEEMLSSMTAASKKAVTESFAAQAVLRKAEESFRQALDERFGRGTEMLMTPADDLAITIGRLTAAEVVAKRQRPDGSVELEVRISIRQDEGTVTRDERMFVVQERGSWKLSLPLALDGTRGAERQAAAERITQGVRQGEYKDRLSAMVALDHAWSAQKGSAK